MSSVANVLYHHTDTSRLPHILSSGKLRPGRNFIGGFPDPDFIWATVDARGDATASAHRGDYYRSGKIWAVRFILDPFDFMPWSVVPDRFPQWTRAEVQRLESICVHGQRSKPEMWFCREAPLSLEKVKNIQVQSYTNNAWRGLPEVVHPLRITDFPDGGPDGYVVEMFGKQFGSRHFPAHAGTGLGDGYELL